MSRIHEALRKAARDRASGQEFQVATADDILRTTYSLVNPAITIGSGEPVPSPPILHTTVRVQQPWAPDTSKMLFCSESADGAGREQFRALRTKFAQLREQRGIKAVLVGSALSGEGKTFVTANLAHAFAVQRENRVLLLDCDLRRGSLSSILGANSTPGLVEYLKQERELQDVLQSGLGGLHFIPSGKRVKEPAELIGSARFRDLISQLRSKFDWILIDSPPAVQFVDANVIADLCDGVLFVVSAEVTPMKLAKRAVQLFKKQSVLGAVLNRAKEIDVPSKYFYRYE
jgi:protein-tyrosine kinase